MNIKYNIMKAINRDLKRLNNNFTDYKSSLHAVGEIIRELNQVLIILIDNPEAENILREKIKYWESVTVMIYKNK